MRGKVYSPKPLSRYDGITPAYAGKSTGVYWCWRNRKDHPRLCGEKAFGWLTTAAGKGSPPPMRGKALSVTFIDNNRRITPAYAGKRKNLLTLSPVK